MVLPGLGPANGCWLGEEHPVITICTDLRLPEASEAVKVRLKKPENQEIKDQSFFSCCFDSQSAERLRESTEEKSPVSQDRMSTEFNRIQQNSTGFLGAATCHGAK